MRISFPVDFLLLLQHSTTEFTHRIAAGRMAEGIHIPASDGWGRLSLLQLPPLAGDCRVRAAYAALSLSSLHDRCQPDRGADVPIVPIQRVGII